ncbi:MAG: nucleotide sugar dehydrogenase [Clostridiales bacterium]|nr:nucleotide sugar dehydrogenase [Clostridiales bacterium]
MAALLAQAQIRRGKGNPARVCVIQRNSPTSGWKVAALNAGKSPIGGIEPELDKIISRAVSERTLYASHDYSEVSDADIILFCVQTDKEEFRPAYGPLFSAIEDTSRHLQRRGKRNPPLVIFESTLAPSSMVSIVRAKFQDFGLADGRDIILANSPNRVMPGRLVERIRTSDKIIGGLIPLAPKLVHQIYSEIVTEGSLHLTNSLTAEIVKTLENAYRDVRIAYATEIARYCDENNLDFYDVRDRVNEKLAREDRASQDPASVPTGALLIPTIGVGGHCLPKDGILLLWRLIESKKDLSGSLILEARRINDESPSQVTRALITRFGSLVGRSVALLGAAYRPESEDTRNSPALVLALELLRMGVNVTLHDPYVRAEDQNLVRSSLQNHFTNDIIFAIRGAEYVVFCVSHRTYMEEIEAIIRAAPKLRGIFDACNLFRISDLERSSISYYGIGRGKKRAPDDFVDFVVDGFRSVERGFSNEIMQAIRFFNENYCEDEFNRVDFDEVRRLAATCVTGCDIAEPGGLTHIPCYHGFSSRLVRNAKRGQFE